MVHEIYGKHGVHDKGDDQGSRQGKDEHRRKIDHELADDPRPEKQREERRQGRQRTRKYGDEDFARRAEALGTPLGQLVAKMLRRREQFRYGSAREVWAELRTLPTWQSRQLFPAR